MRPTPNRIRKLTEEFEQSYLNKAMKMIRDPEYQTQEALAVEDALFILHTALKLWYADEVSLQPKK